LTTVVRKLRRIGGASGFTLLEIMIAMAILSGGLVWLIVGVTRNIKAENHAKLMTTGTFLARQEMIDIEDQLYEKGFSEFEKDSAGNFEDKGFARFTWKVTVDKVELPSASQLQTVLTNAQQAKQQLGGTTDPSTQTAGGLSSPLGGLLGGGGGLGDPTGAGSSGSPLGAGAGALAQQFGVIKDVIEQALRRVTVDVVWFEGRTPQQVELMAYYTDVRRVDQAIQITSAAATGKAGGSGSAGGSGAGGGGGTH
jgi:prepilin-type N-terminal cleavage/methylation domain-containing protein